jgi:hypothetical protein
MKKFKRPNGVGEILGHVVLPLVAGSSILWFPLILDAGVKGWLGYFLGFLVGAYFMAFKIDLGEQ